MKKNWLFLALAMIFLTGCNDTKPPYNGSVRLDKTGGNVTCVEVRFPDGVGESRVVFLRNRYEAEAMADQLRSMLKDIEYAKEQMVVEEPGVKQ